MLEYRNSPPLRSVDNVDNVGRAETPSETLQTILDFISRRYREIGFAAAITIALAVIYLLTATPSYTAAASMLIDSNKIQLFQQQSVFNDLPMDEAAVESQVEVLKSENIASGCHQAIAPNRRLRIRRFQWRVDWHGVRLCNGGVSNE